MKKEKVFQHHENRVLIRYTLLEAHSSTTLRLRPFLAFRSVREYTHENSIANRDYQQIDNGIKTCMYPSYPELYMQLNKKNEFIYTPDWYRGVRYPKELERSYAFNEELYVPGYFEYTIRKGESVIFAAGISEISSNQLKKTFEHEVDARLPRDNYYNSLVNAAHQFHMKRDGESYILAGYPWFKCRARDMFIALPGLTLAIDEAWQYEACMATATKAIDDFIAGRPISVRIYEMEQPDVLLWAIWCIQQYSSIVSPEKCYERYGDLLQRIVTYVMDEKHDNLQLHENGLLYSRGREKAITWMNSTVNGHPVVARSGYIVEFNALWYNALRFAAEQQEKFGDKEQAAQYEALAEHTAKSFKEVFLNEYGYLLDYVDGTMMDWSVRPNMIFAVALDYSPLNAHEKKGVLDICTKELLTPKGLRSLSPKSGGYNPMYVGPQVQRDHAYHQGTAWPWLEIGRAHV